jgi:hypothetical protein
MRVSSTVIAFAVTFSQCLADFNWQSPVYNHFYQFPMPVPPTKEVKFTFTSPTTGLPIDYYEVVITELTRQQYPGLLATPQVGYDGIVPGTLDTCQLLTETSLTFVCRTHVPDPTRSRVCCPIYQPGYSSKSSPSVRTQVYSSYQMPARRSTHDALPFLYSRSTQIMWRKKLRGGQAWLLFI